MFEFLTDVVVFPQVADCHVASQQHSYTTDTTLLHINVLVVVSVVAWKHSKARKKKKQHKQQYTDTAFHTLGALLNISKITL